MLVHGSPSLARFVEDRAIGVVIGDATSATEIRHAIGQILADYARYSSNARACYEAEFDFDLVSSPVLKAMHDMCPANGSARDRRSTPSAGDEGR